MNTSLMRIMLVSISLCWLLSAKTHIDDQIDPSIAEKIALEQAAETATEEKKIDKKDYTGVCEEHPERKLKVSDAHRDLTPEEIAMKEAYYLENPGAERDSDYPSNMQWLFGIMAVALLAEVVVGTEIRGGLEMIRKENPMVESQFLLDMLGPFKYAHSILGFLITILSVYIWHGLVKRSSNPSSLMVQTSTIIVLLILLQIVLGEILVFLKVIPLIQLFHLWIASWILGLVSVQYVAWQRSRVAYE